MSSGATPSVRARLVLCVIDGALLGLFMSSVGVFAALMYAPESPVLRLFPGELARRALMGLAMGLTAIGLIYSPLGGRSGAHMNPAVTIAYVRLGRIRPALAAGYIAGQLALGTLGVVAIGLVVGPWFTDAPVRYAPTVPGKFGVAAAFAAELAMTFTLMLILLIVSNTKRLAAYTPVFAGLMVFLYITIEAPVSGMSINPARTLASAIASGEFSAIWVYLTAPVLGMLAAAELYTRLPRLPAVHCCKLNHLRHEACVHCGCDGPIDFGAHASPSRNEPTNGGKQP
ncbi:MAG: hypothetical protein C0513_05630 [Isosphaera sp.]|nr:hypothetical protein [Isosphaera sp.]